MRGTECGYKEGLYAAETKQFKEILFSWGFMSTTLVYLKQQCL